ncbi:TetR family transcriptional regulator [Myceligenerans pegani]|uniref:TetR family transcriptional regulator n=1 Tax=Myceligenerans pegani TaxID=2776917 RepID=A0ABR9N3X7_9MICO|nr:TetR family transcriptional regulator [Myceligenerans sp. TRM 65318]MBE1878370.1 TetR family transcriptional regulator [Myceligenerans sp. TRM 65318]MBE3020641.1 TetR family transcriptional regulator [Myceligenerans sp. TRM 65318]
MPESSPPESSARRRILDAALDRFGRDGVNRVTVRAIASDAGVSPALVVHHFGSMEGVRRECDRYVMSMVRGPDHLVEDAAAGNASGLAGMLEAAAPVRRYLARAFLDGSPAANALFDEIVEHTAAWLAGGEREGWVRPSENPHARAAIYVSWLLAPLAFGAHLTRALGVDDLHATGSALWMSRVAIDMFTHGVFTDERMLHAWDAVEKERGAR